MKRDRWSEARRGVLSIHTLLTVNYTCRVVYWRAWGVPVPMEDSMWPLVSSQGRKCRHARFYIRPHSETLLPTPGPLSEDSSERDTGFQVFHKFLVTGNKSLTLSTSETFLRNTLIIFVTSESRCECKKFLNHHTEQLPRHSRSLYVLAWPRLPCLSPSSFIRLQHIPRA